MEENNEHYGREFSLEILLKQDKDEAFYHSLVDDANSFLKEKFGDLIEGVSLVDKTIQP